MSRVCVVTDTGADVDKRVAEAWARVEAGLSRVLAASLRQLNAPAPGAGHPVIADGGLDRIGCDASLCFAFLRHSGLRL